MIGPDEYHETIDEIAFTSVMARWTIRHAVDVLALMRVRWPVTWPTLSGQIVLTAADLAQLASVADATAIGFDPKTDLFEHFAGLLTLGVVSIRFPQLLGNGKDVSGLTSINKVPFATVRKRRSAPTF